MHEWYAGVVPCQDAIAMVDATLYYAVLTEASRGFSGSGSLGHSG